MNIKLRFFIFSAVYILMWEACEASANLKTRGFSKKCTKCPPGWGVVKRCTSVTDTHCVKCVQGETYSSQRSSKSPCWPCSKCGVGLYEAHECSPARDTICSECISYLDRKNVTNSRSFLQKCTYVFL